LRIADRYPVLRTLSDVSAVETTLDELEQENVIQAFWVLKKSAGDIRDAEPTHPQPWRKTMKIAATIALLLLTATPEAFAAGEWTERASKNSVEVTVEKLIAAVEGAGAKVFATVDHAAGTKVSDRIWHRRSW
jgi:hypothetical protein